eukprot:TRINITY_DN43512_c0_g1_i1.p1 TRINITY_DN43512_c0_g1~~TRINITY_DN43512_c0_g1_i1.p1  ORF type:complete len:419 (+),score=125.82 TRINITY_DN43512_c0_g1_i1:58-1314(+)
MLAAADDDASPGVGRVALMVAGPVAVLGAARVLRGAAHRRARRMSELTVARDRLQPRTVPISELGLRARRQCPRCEELCPGCVGTPDFSALQKLGDGAHAPVYLSSWRGKPVTVKLTQFSSLRPFLNEVDALEAVKGHPNVVSIVGVNLDGVPTIVYEFAPGRSLHEICRRRVRPLAFHLQVSVARQLAEAMAHVHRCGLMHRDLKSPNVVVDVNSEQTDCVVKLIDLGSARFRTPRAGDRPVQMEYLSPAEARPPGVPREPDRIVHPARLHSAWLRRAEQAEQTLAVGTFDWMAPEMWLGEYGPKADVYSFAVVLYELATGRLPWDDFAAEDSSAHHDQALLKQWIEEGLRPHLPGMVRRPFFDLIQRCWAGHAQSRPSFEEISEHLRELEQHRDLWIDQWRAKQQINSFENMDMGG